LILKYYLRIINPTNAEPEIETDPNSWAKKNHPKGGVKLLQAIND